MALNSQDEAEANQRADAVERQVGHPVYRWETLRDRVQNQGTKLFADVADDWLGFIWCLDAYRTAQAPPRGMGNLEKAWRERLGAIYRKKGDYFATLVALLLENRTGQRIRSRSKIKGFSQEHQIDVAWPDRNVDPLVCSECKVSGAPPYGNTPARGINDFASRRKELKFAAADLKLARRQQATNIAHWDVWRHNASPKTFLLWGVRLSPSDTTDKIASQADALVRTYLDGAGVFVWQRKASDDGYEPLALPSGYSVLDFDDVLWRVESEITALVQQAGGQTPPVEQLDIPVTSEAAEEP